MKKILIIGVILIVAVVGVGVYVLMSSLDSAVKTAVEQIGPEQRLAADCLHYSLRFATIRFGFRQQLKAGGEGVMSASQRRSSPRSRPRCPAARMALAPPSPIPAGGQWR